MSSMVSWEGFELFYHERGLNCVTMGLILIVSPWDGFEVCQCRYWYGMGFTFSRVTMGRV